MTPLEARRSRRVRNKLALATGLVLGGAIVAWSVMFALWPESMMVLIDAKVYRAGGQVVLEGSPLYDNGVLGDMKFTYTPFAALLFTPLAALTTPEFQILVYVANPVLVLLAARRSGLLLGNQSWVFTILITGISLLLEPILWSTMLGQVNLVILVLVLWDLSRAPGARGRGVGVGIAAAIKITPGLFIVHLILTGQRRAACWATSAFAGAVGVGFLVLPRDSREFWFTSILETDRVGVLDAWGNQSLNGLVTRLLGVGSTSYLIWLVLAVVFGCLGLWVARRLGQRAAPLCEIAMVGMLCCALSPMSWTHHWVWFLPMVAFLIHHHRDLVFRHSWLPLTAVLVLTFSWPVVFPEGERPVFGLFILPPYHGLEVIWLNPYILAMIILMIWGYRMTTRTGDPGDVRESVELPTDRGRELASIK